MKHADKAAARQIPSEPAATAGARSQVADAFSGGFEPGARASVQRALIDGIHHGPRMALQRRQLSHLLGERRVSPWVPSAQLKELPDDSVGSLKDMPVKGEKELTAEGLQKRLIDKLKEVGQVGFGYRLVSLRYQAGEFEKDEREKHHEAHGMKPWPTTIDDNLGDIKLLVHSTLQAAGQLAYLEKNAVEISQTHEVIVDVDWYRERTQSDVGFHKDSRGTTLFVNLTYDNALKMQGASTKPDLKGQAELEKGLPDEVQNDLKARREDYAQKGLGPGDIKEEEVDPYARISFSDPSVWHSTPLLGHRIEHEPPPTDDVETVEKYLRRAGHDPYVYRGIVEYYKVNYKPQVIFDFFRNKKGSKNQVTVESWDVLAPELSKLGYTARELGGWHGDYPSPLGFWNALQGTDRIDKYNKHGISDKIIPEDGPALTEAVKVKRRPLSVKLNENPLLQNDLNEEAKRPRTFIRTWVRLIKI